MRPRPGGVRGGRRGRRELFVPVAEAGHSVTICLPHPWQARRDGINLMVPSPLEMQTFLFPWK